MSNYLDRGALADKAFTDYEFGDGVMVTDTSGWEYTTPGHERTRKIYIETEAEDDGPSPRWVLNFTVRFDPETGGLSEAYAIDEKGQIWGTMPSQIALQELRSNPHTVEQRLTLFSVMLPWHPDDSEQGTYEASVWTQTSEEAVLAVAQMMADHEDSGCESDEERASFASALVDSGLAVTMAVEDTVIQDLKALLSGPSGNFDSVAKSRLESISSLLHLAKETHGPVFPGETSTDDRSSAYPRPRH